jgi:hypothetical protein
VARVYVPLQTATLRNALVATTVLATAGLVAGAVRLLPWVVDPHVPWSVAGPFARGLASLAIEAALFVGWPVGWAVAAVRFVESGEARALETLGEPPSRTVLRLAPQAAGFAAALALVALVGGRDASAPGRIVTELLAKGRASCASARAPTTYAVPFTELTWLCAPRSPDEPPGWPRLVGRATSALSGAIFSAADARVAGDFRSIELDDARLLVAGPPEIEVHVGRLSLRGLAPWSRASNLPPALRALLFGLSGSVAAAFAVMTILRGRVARRIWAILIGATGPLGALGLVRLLERADAPAAAFLVIPLALALVMALGMAGVALRAPLAR